MGDPLTNRSHALTESWATMADDSAQSVELTSDEDDVPQPRPLPQVNLRASRMYDLRDALSRGEKAGQRSFTHQKDAHTVDEVETKADVTPKRRANRVGRNPTFVMPTLKVTSSHESSAEKPRTRRVTGSRAGGNESKGTKALPRANQTSNANGLESVWRECILPVITYFFQILGMVARITKPFVGYGLAIYLILGALIMARNFVSHSFHQAISPICRLPGATSLLSVCAEYQNQRPRGSVEFDKLIATQAAFEDILNTSAESATLPMDMKRSEASIRDLRQVVEFSHLPSRNELVMEFTGFIKTAREASADLAKYNSRIGRAVDRILSTNRWTLQVLEAIEATRSEQGSLSRFVEDSVNIFSPFLPVSRKPRRDALYDQYIRHTSAVEEQIQGLITEAQALLVILDNLDGRLDVIASIAGRDGMRIEVDKDELLAQLWTLLGGNRSSVNKLQKQMAVLQEVNSYRKLAFAHVSTTVLKLQVIAAALEDLRERVARPEVLGLGGTSSLHRDDIPLEMHIGEIVLGLERLESVRESGRRAEGERLRSVLGGSEKPGIAA